MPWSHLGNNTAYRRGSVRGGGERWHEPDFVRRRDLDTTPYKRVIHHPRTDYTTMMENDKKAPGVGVVGGAGSVISRASTNDDMGELSETDEKVIRQNRQRE